MLEIVLFLRGICKEQETEGGVLRGQFWPTDATSSQHNTPVRSLCTHFLLSCFPFVQLSDLLTLILGGLAHLSSRMLHLFEALFRDGFSDIQSSLVGRQRGTEDIERDVYWCKR